MIYFHTDVGGWFATGPIKTLKQALLHGKEEEQQHLKAFHGIHMSYYARSYF